VYSFNKVNNLYPLLTKTEYLLKSAFRSMYSLISKPVYLIKHDKVIIRLFIYLSPKIDKYLDTSTIGLENCLSNKHNKRLDSLSGPPGGVFNPAGEGQKRSIAGFSSRINRFKIGKFLKFKSLRPNVIEILKSQIQSDVRGTYIPLQIGGKIAKNNLFANSLFSNNSIFNLIGSNKRLNLLQSRSACLVGEHEEEVSIKTNKLVNKSGAAYADLLLSNPQFPYKSLVSNFKFNLEKLCLIFEKIFNKKVEFEIIKAQLPFQDSNVLAQILGYNANNYKFRRMLKILIPRAVIKNPSKVFLRSQNKVTSFNPLTSSAPKTEVAYHLPMDSLSSELPPRTKSFTSQPSSYLPPLFYNKYNFNIETANSLFGYLKDSSLSYLSGINIKLAGRLMTQSIRPRFTVQSLQEGSLARVKVHYIEKSRFTGKNKRGAFSFTVTISHVFN
jgi:hypothetical protein